MQMQQDTQREHYRKTASEYDERNHRENSNHLYKIEQIARALFQNLPPKPEGYDFLELGGGTGIHAQSFLLQHQERVRSFTLSDISPEMLEQAKQRLRRFDVSYLESTGEDIATPRTFDGIYVSGAMHHFADPVAAIASVSKRLNPGGVFAICEPIVWNPINFVKAVMTGVDWGQFHTTRRNVRRFLRDAGYRIVTDRVLHWKGPSERAHRYWPYDRLENVKWLDPAAVMFLFAATR